MKTQQELEQKFQDLIKEAIEQYFKMSLALRQQEGRNNKNPKI